MEQSKLSELTGATLNNMEKKDQKLDKVQLGDSVSYASNSWLQLELWSQDYEMSPALGSMLNMESACVSLLLPPPPSKINK